MMNQNGFSLFDLCVGLAASMSGMLVLSALVGNMNAAAIRSHEMNRNVRSTTEAVEHITRIGRCASFCQKKNLPRTTAETLRCPTLTPTYDVLDCIYDPQMTGIQNTNVRFGLAVNPGNCNTTLQLSRRSGQTNSEAEWEYATSPYLGVVDFKLCDVNQLRNGNCAFGSPNIQPDSQRYFRFQLKSSKVNYAAATPNYALGGLEVESSFFYRTDGSLSESLLQCAPFENQGS